jgi:hypothetical protein
MRDKVWNSQLIAPPEFLNEKLRALPPKLIVGRGEVDEVAVMADGVLELKPQTFLLPRIDLLDAQRFAFPDFLVLRKHLHRRAAKRLGLQERVMHSAGDGKMTAKHPADSIGALYVGEMPTSE